MKNRHAYLILAGLLFIAGSVGAVRGNFASVLLFACGGIWLGIGVAKCTFEREE